MFSVFFRFVPYSGQQGDETFPSMSAEQTLGLASQIPVLQPMTTWQPISLNWILRIACLIIGAIHTGGGLACLEVASLAAGGSRLVDFSYDIADPGSRERASGWFGKQFYRIRSQARLHHPVWNEGVR